MLRVAASRAHCTRRLVLHHRCACTEAAETVGLGFVTDELQGVSRATLIKAMMGHVDTPERFDPSVAHVSVRAASGDAFHEGALWRSLTRNDGETEVEHCYAIYGKNPSAKQKTAREGHLKSGKNMPMANRRMVGLLKTIRNIAFAHRSQHVTCRPAASTPRRTCCGTCWTRSPGC